MRIAFAFSLLVPFATSEKRVCGSCTLKYITGLLLSEALPLLIESVCPLCPELF